MAAETQKFNEKRKYYRHPVWAPLRYEIIGGHGEADGLASSDMCLMGLRFTSPEELHEGVLLRIIITLREQDFELLSRVEWQASLDDENWDTGVSFLTESNAFKARMLEQVLEIEQYRISRSTEAGTEITFEHAAREWTAEGAADYSQRFPH